MPGDSPVKLLWLCSLYLAGIVAGSRHDASGWLLTACLLPLALVFSRRFRKKALWGSLSLLMLFTGLLSSSAAAFTPDPGMLAWYNNSETITVSAVINREVQIHDSSQHLRLNCREVSCGGENSGATGQLLVYAPRYPEYEYGDGLLLTGMLEDPPVFVSQTTGEIEFDYAGYLANQGVFSVMAYPEIQVISEGNGNPFMTGLYSLKKKLSLSLERVLPEPGSSLACGVLLGERHKIPQDIQDNFSRSGAFHLLAISGFHLGIVAAMALGVGRFIFGRRGYIYILLAFLVIWLYALIAGSGAPVIRAAIMASIFLLAELFGRQKNALPALALAASIMVAVDPKIINTASFQMSFAAMAGIMLFYSGLRSIGRQLIVRWTGERGRVTAFSGLVTDGLAVSMAATIFVLPLTLHYFGLFSPLGPLVTLLLVPAMMPVMVTSALVAMLGLFWPAVAMLPGWLCWVCSSYMLIVTGWFSSPDAVYAENIYLSGFWVAFYYTAILAVYLAVVTWKRTKKSAAVAGRNSDQASQSGHITPGAVFCLLLCVLCVLAITVPAGCQQEERMEISFLDVGQGDAVLVSQGSTQVLIDGGPSPAVLMRQLAGKMPFFDRTIEVVVLTHPHADHINGLLEVLRRYNVTRVIYPVASDALEGYEGSAYREWLSLIEERQITAVLARDGMNFNMGDAVFTVINPPGKLHSGTISDIDNNSIVLELAAGDFSFLLTGDLMREGELELVMERKISPVNILKVAHHGSKTSSSFEFLAVARPDIGVICVGENNFGHPDDNVLNRISSFAGREAVLRTDEYGGVTFITDGCSLWVKTGTCNRGAINCG